jgi:dihydropteroate synthase
MVYSDKKLIWRCGHSTLDLGSRTHIMGILNVTPDSFSDGGRYYDSERAVERALELEEEGADIIDIGGESTRPGAEAVSEREELDRVLPIIQRLSPVTNALISIDTYKSTVARHALDAGATIVNDISGLRFDRDMAAVAARASAGVVIMHIKGTPRDMQKNPFYDNVIDEIILYFEKSKKTALKGGLDEEQLVFDPGIGFGKRLHDNFVIIRDLHQFKCLRRPLLIGPSRKSFIGQTLDVPVEERLEGTLAAVTACVLRGANIVRVHDVTEVKRAVIIADAIEREKEDAIYPL